MVLAALFVLGGGSVAAIAVSGNEQSPPTTPRATPTETPEEKFVDDMNSEFAEAMNPDKDPISDFFDYRRFTDKIANDGHEICAYLGSHSYEETAQQFKAFLGRAGRFYPTDSDARAFVNIAIDDLCPQYSSMKTTPSEQPVATVPSAPTAPPAVESEGGSLNGTQSPMLGIALPDGSKGTWNVNDFNKDGQPNHFENWVVPLSYDATVAYLTDQLAPHYTRPDGTPWYDSHPTEGEIGERYLDWWWGVREPELLVRIQEFGERNETMVMVEGRTH